MGVKIEKIGGQNQPASPVLLQACPFRHQWARHPCWKGRWIAFQISASSQVFFCLTCLLFASRFFEAPRTLQIQPSVVLWSCRISTSCGSEVIYRIQRGVETNIKSKLQNPPQLWTFARVFHHCIYFIPWFKYLYKFVGRKGWKIGAPTWTSSRYPS